MSELVVTAATVRAILTFVFPGNAPQWFAPSLVVKLREAIEPAGEATKQGIDQLHILLTPPEQAAMAAAATEVAWVMQVLAGVLSETHKPPAPPPPSTPFLARLQVICLN